MRTDDTDDTAATMTVEQAGRLLGISRRSAYRAAAAGQIPTIRLGRRLVVPTARLHRLLGLDQDAGGAEAPAESTGQADPADQRDVAPAAVVVGTRQAVAP